ncbi:MAG TPA: hypothetical protein DEG47_14980, partial [Cyanobacteria bacterium UBA11148]|nr:hypothetical protein [Cyanobacteria bacterium UBA11148]
KFLHSKFKMTKTDDIEPLIDFLQLTRKHDSLSGMRLDIKKPSSWGKNWVGSNQFKKGHSKRSH